MGLGTHEDVLHKVTRLAGVLWYSEDVAQIKKKMRATWKNLNQHVALEKQKREKFLTELSKEASRLPDQEKAIKNQSKGEVKESIPSNSYNS